MTTTAAMVESAATYLGMVLAQFAQVGLMIMSKQAMSSGMTNFTFIFYSNALASLILLPSSFLFHRRSSRPPLTLKLLCGLFLLGVCGMEKVDFSTSSTMAKTVGTIVSIAGASILTLYRGPQILTTSSSLKSHYQYLDTQQSDWVIGGLLLTIDCVASSAFIIVQAFVLKHFPAELIIVFSYCFFAAILSAVVSLIIEKDLSSWQLQPSVRYLAVLYSGVLGYAFRVGVTTWCLHRTGPLFIAMFQPLGIVIAAALGIIFLHEGFYLGSLVGSIIIVLGFYSVMWGKAKEVKALKDMVRPISSDGENTPLL